MLEVYISSSGCCWVDGYTIHIDPTSVGLPDDDEASRLSVFPTSSCVTSPNTSILNYSDRIRSIRLQRGKVDRTVLMEGRRFLRCGLGSAGCGLRIGFRSGWDYGRGVGRRVMLGDNVGKGTIVFGSKQLGPTDYLWIQDTISRRGTLLEKFYRHDH